MSTIEVYADQHAPEWAIEAGSRVYAAWHLARLVGGAVIDIARALR